MNWHTKSAHEAARYFEVNPAMGLTQPEAQRRLAKTGANRIRGKKGKSLFKKILEQLSDFLVLILLAAAVISLGVSIWQGEADFIEPVIILLIVVTNAIMGILQESKAEKAIESLQKLSAPKATVLRDGVPTQIDSQDVVVGDVLLLETGDCVTADARLLESTALRVEESSLTGESAPVDKVSDTAAAESAPISERTNMLHSGSMIVSGRCKALVTATGMATEVGKIATLLDEAETPQTPLQKKLAKTGKTLGIVALLTCGLIFALGVAQRTPALESFMLAVSLAVAAVPEGLPAIVTIVLALGVTRMAAKNAIVRKLPAVETLGGATVICSDKTGTLTQNRMTVQRLVGADGRAVDGKQAAWLLTCGSLCSNSVETMEGSALRVTGDPTENAIVHEAHLRGITKQSASNAYPRLSELPFDSSRKRMTTVHRAPGGYLSITKGAPDVLIALCTQYEDGSGVHPLDEAARRRILAANDDMAGHALRVIAVATKKADTPAAQAQAEQNLVLLGLIAMIDPPRPEAKSAVAQCQRAGIKPIMITGDHAATAAAIARQLGILKGPGNVVTGPELDRLSDAQLRSVVKHTGVFARVSPEHKSRVVKALQENGEIVAMTGDGVNDAPALKTADIGCAMGKSGTDVARDASDMVLTDDNFATIVAAVKEGRGIYQNICKAVHFLLSCNIGEILVILAATLLGMPAPLLPIQLLWVNMVTDSLPALALGVEAPDRDIMDRAPVKPGGSMFGEGRGPRILLQGLMIGALALSAYVWGALTDGTGLGRTYSFAVLSLSQLVHAFNIRSDESLLRVGIFSNSKMVLAFLACVAMQVLVICIPPVAAVFQVVPLNISQWGHVAFLSFVPFILVELGKALVPSKHVRRARRMARAA